MQHRALAERRSHQDLQTGTPFTQFVDQCRARQPAGQHHVRKDQRDIRMLHELLQRLMAVGRFQHAIAQTSQDIDRCRAYFSVVLHNENGFPPAGQLRRQGSIARDGIDDLRAALRGRNNCTVVPLPTALLIRTCPPDWRTNPYTMGRPKSAALADVLGGEEGLEHPLQRLRRHARAVVLNFKHSIVAWLHGLAASAGQRESQSR